MLGKHIIAGTFGRFIVPGFPAALQHSAIYLNVSDFNGQHRLRFRLVQLSDGKELATSAEIPITHNDRLNHFEMNIALPPLQFPAPGVYAIEVLWNEQFLGQCRIHLALHKGETHGPA